MFTNLPKVVCLLHWLQLRWITFKCFLCSGIFNFLLFFNLKFSFISFFSKTQIQWPPELKALYKALSIFNFNLNLMPPGTFLFFSFSSHS